MTMTAKLEFLRIYTRNEDIIRVYLIDCSEELKQLMKEKNKHYCEDKETGKPLYFSNVDLSMNPSCEIHTNGMVRFVTVDLLEGFI